MYLGISAEPQEALHISQAKQDGNVLYEHIQLLSLGFFADCHIPKGIGRALRDAQIEVTCHPIELNLPTDMSDSVVALLDTWVDELEPLWIEQDAAIWLQDQRTYMGAQIITPPLTRESASRIARSAASLSERWQRPFYVENPPIFTSAGGDLGSFEWMAAIIAEGAEVTLDIGHIMGAQINLREPLGSPTADWVGWASVRSLHLSGQRVLNTVHGPVWLDDHAAHFSEMQLRYAAKIVEKSKEARALCLEMEGADPQVLTDNVRTAERLIRLGSIA